MRSIREEGRAQQEGALARGLVGGWKAAELEVHVEAQGGKAGAQGGVEGSWRFLRRGGRTQQGPSCSGAGQPTATIDAA